MILVIILYLHFVARPHGKGTKFVLSHISMIIFSIQCVIHSDVHLHDIAVGLVGICE